MSVNFITEGSSFKIPSDSLLPTVAACVITCIVIVRQFIVIHSTVMMFTVLPSFVNSVVHPFSLYCSTISKRFLKEGCFSKYLDTSVVSTP